MTDFKKAYRDCEQKLSAITVERDRLQKESIESQENKESLKLLRRTTEKQRTEIDELKAQVDWLESWIQESLTESVEGDPGLNVDPTKSHICPCGCGNRISDIQKDNTVYFTPGCNDRVKKRINYLTKKGESQS